ncbi:tRNA (guanosine(37)-N1)-methyltransferase TrmD [Spiroplasma cantharicola]|uniref:tRNA (guanine-N(1)-)-methyltransferase n=1 Tax=Spiroplasma cantharicola TaxID=362837 RepID=A0A0M4JWB2_9MOLU|nr:tRNA (guanosine(37)-N1)-methyltransferase TrmD [Spiroplasma cantharicola]ALD66205.1 tRNA (guanine-N(1)-)-methyltransferase [Spiroplasma cantharicola]
MKFSIITLFPNLINSYISESIIKRAIEKNSIDVEVIDLRKHTKLKHNQVDDYQLGGGKGMVLMVEPVVNAIESCKRENSLVVLTSPQGKTWNQNLARKYSLNYEHIILVCGHYEGFDERILDYVDLELSIGDYVLTGGEIASIVILDSITRLLEGVIAKDSHLNDSFENNLLDHPVYTKPIEFRGKKAPEVLTSGHHANVEKYRQEGRLRNTFNKRPDLLEKSELSKSDLDFIEKLKKLKGDN